MNNEALKQNFADVARCYVGGLLGLGVCCNTISAELRLCRTAVSHRHCSDVDDAMVQRHLR
jgi:hypothetical protein